MDARGVAAMPEPSEPPREDDIMRACQAADALEGRIRAASLGGRSELKGKKDGFEILALDEIIG